MPDMPHRTGQASISGRSFSEDPVFHKYIARTLGQDIGPCNPNEKYPHDPIRGIIEAVKESGEEEDSFSELLIVDAALFSRTTASRDFAGLRRVRKRLKTVDPIIAVVTQDLELDQAAYAEGADFVLPVRFQADQFLSSVTTLQARLRSTTAAARKSKRRATLRQLFTLIIGAGLTLLVGLLLKDPKPPECRQLWDAAYELSQENDSSLSGFLYVRSLRTNLQGTTITISRLPPEELVRIENISVNDKLKLAGTEELVEHRIRVIVRGTAEDLQKRHKELRISLSGPGHADPENPYPVYLPHKALIDLARISSPQVHPRSDPPPLPNGGVETSRPHPG